jgi:hypothetical protein
MIRAYFRNTPTVRRELKKSKLTHEDGITIISYMKGRLIIKRLVDGFRILIDKHKGKLILIESTNEKALARLINIIVLQYPTEVAVTILEDTYVKYHLGSCPGATWCIAPSTNSKENQDA